jgi:cation:H+ antiporter
MKRDLPMAIGGGILLLLLTMDQVFRGKFSSSALDFSGKEVIGRVDRFDGILFVILFIIYLVVLVKMALKAREEHKMTEEMVEFEKYEDDVKTLSVPKSIVLIIGGAAAIVLGGQLVVDSSSNIAASFGLSQTMIGLTICAVGTSLPELVTSVVAIKKGEDGMALGNIVGSCVFNIFFVLAISGTLNPISVLVANFYDLLFLAVTSLFLYLCSFKKKYVNRVEGVILFLLYVIYMVYVVIR